MLSAGPPLPPRQENTWRGVWTQAQHKWGVAGREEAAVILSRLNTTATEMPCGAEADTMRYREMVLASDWAVRACTTLSKAGLCSPAR